MTNQILKTLTAAFYSALLCLSCSSILFAQEVTGTLVGTVRDSNGAAVPNAAVTITDPSKDNIVVRTLTTNDGGEFSAPNLNISTYQITVEAANFKKTVQTDIKLDIGQRRNVEITLEAGNVAEVVTVEADPVAVDLNTPTASTVINGEQVRELSINNRNFLQLVTLAPGVTNDLSDQVYVGTVNPDGQTNTVNISVNGSRSSQNTFTVDGADITDRGSNLTVQTYPSVDSIQEFRVLRSLYPAESGRSGGGQVNVITRSGTDRFSGTLYEFVRNEAFNANDFITNFTAAGGRDEDGRARRRPFRYNNFGYTIGGPIYFLGFGEGGPTFKKYDRTFFFFSQEFRRDIRYPILDSNVPNVQARQGTFPVDICLRGEIVGTTRTCLDTLTAGESILSRANPVSLQYLTNIFNRLPLPNSATTLTPFRLLFPALNKADFQQEILKIDHSFNEKLSAFYRFQNDTIPTLDATGIFPPRTSVPNVSTTDSDSPGRTHTFQMTYAATPNLIFEGRYAYAYGAILSQNAGLLNRETSPINVRLPYDVQRDRIPSITGYGFTDLQGFGPYDNFSNKNDFSGSVTWIFGGHTTKYGAVFSRYRKNENALAGVNEGVFSNFFNTNPASVTATQGSVLATGVANTAANNSYQSFANFLLGTNASFTQAQFDYTADLRSNNFEAYAQDEWRVRRNLTLYFGVRYSYFGMPKDENGRLTNFDPRLFNRQDAPSVRGTGDRVFGNIVINGNTVAATNESGRIPNICSGIIVNTNANPVLPSVPNCTPTPSPYGEKVVDTPKNNFAPRVGFAFDPFGKGTTSIRAGYGIYHEQILSGIFLQNIGTNPPFQQTFSVTRININNLPAPSIQTGATTQALRAVQPDWETPYMQHWSLDLQQQLTRRTVFSIGYYGSKGTNLIGVTDINLLPPGLAQQPTSLCATGTNYFGQPSVPIATAQCQATGVPFTARAFILDQIRPYRGYSAINIIQPRYNSDYHSMQLSAQHRFTGASQINVAYTWAKNLTDSQNDRSSAPQNPYDISLERGRALLDRRHVFTTNFVYELPFFDKQEGFVGKLLGGFQTSGIFTYQTGLPFTPTVTNYDPAGIGFLGPSAAAARANVISNPNQNAPGTFLEFFDVDGVQRIFPFSGVAPVPGNAARGIIEGPATTRFDLTLTKNLRFTETIRLQLRAEAFNIFNTTNFRGLNVGQSATALLTAFGTVSSVRDPRQLQFGAKFYF